MRYCLKLKMSHEAMEEIAQKVLQNNMDLTKMRETLINKDSAFTKVLPLKKRFHPSMYSDFSYDKEHTINEEFASKKMKLTDKEVTLAAFNTIQLRLSDKGHYITSRKEHYNRFFEIRNHLNTCAVPDCEYCLMTKITDDKSSSFLLLNHVVRCINPYCSNKSCFIIKNLMKYNSFQEDFKLEKDKT